jgi:Putative MetA-pathway of phenol degradation
MTMAVHLLIRGLTAQPNLAAGIGDVIFRGKFQAIKRERAGLTLGVDLHTPSGAETQFLGSGTWGVRPFAACSYLRRIAPHASLGYQINGNSILAADPTTAAKRHLPNVISYDAGVDAGVSKRASLSADFIGQSLLRAEKLVQVTRLIWAVFVMADENLDGWNQAAKGGLGPALASVSVIWSPRPKKANTELAQSK